MCVFLQCAVIILGKVSFGFFGSSTLPLSAYDKMISEAMHFILACYNMSHCQDLTQARQELWKIKMAKCLAGPPSFALFHPLQRLSLRMPRGPICSWLFGIMLSIQTTPSWSYRPWLDMERRLHLLLSLRAPIWHQMNE